MVKQIDLFGEVVKEDYEKEWQEMPEFHQEDLGPWKQIIVSFKNWEDLQDFSKLLDQPITMKTKSLWYPEAKIDRLMDKRWITEEEE